MDNIQDRNANMAIRLFASPTAPGTVIAASGVSDRPGSASAAW